MKKMFVVFFCLVTFFACIKSVKADCRDFINEAENISVKTENYVSDEGAVFIRLVIEGITENTYVVVVDDVLRKNRVYHYSDSDNGKVIVGTPDIYKNVKFIVNTYVSDTSCSKDIIKKVNKEMPAFNSYHINSICKTEHNLKICAPFYEGNNDKTPDEFIKEASKELEYLNRTFLDKLWDFLKEYYLYILVPVIIVSGIFIVRIVILLRGRKNDAK